MIDFQTPCKTTKSFPCRTVCLSGWNFYAGLQSWYVIADEFIVYVIIHGFDKIVWTLCVQFYAIVLDYDFMVPCDDENKWTKCCVDKWKTCDYMREGCERCDFMYMDVTCV